MTIPGRLSRLLPSLLLACTPARCGDAFDILVYVAPRLTAPTLDGRLDEADWQKAPLVGGFLLYGKETKAQPPTFFRAAYDDHALYFGVVCHEPHMDRFAPPAHARDAHAIFGSETIEVFIDPEHSHSVYYQFGLDAAGSIYDSRCQDAVWNASVRTAVAVQGDRWVLEAAIPWEDLGVKPFPGRLLGFNICRDRQIDGKQWTNWSRVVTGFHDPIRFAHLVLDPAGPLPPGAAAELRQGDRSGAVVLFTAEGFGGASYRTMAREALDGARRSLDDLDRLAQTETSPATARELLVLADRCRQSVDELAARIASPHDLDAETWSHLDLQFSRLQAGLAEAVWTARLTALLSEL